MHLSKSKNRVFPVIIVLLLVLISCGNGSKSAAQNTKAENESSKTETTKLESNIVVAANRTEAYLPMLKGKRVGIVANQTSVIFAENKATGTHLVDSLKQLQVNIKCVFAPEHGFRGEADAGQLITDGVDPKTQLPVISLYGNNKKPTPKQLEGIELMIFDIQDVGARFYTYISTLHYIMEACAEAKIPLLILDRPNPNGYYVDGPILEPQHKSFVGMHPIPVVHGMTIAEYAQMINGEKWLKDGLQCELSIIPMKNYNHDKRYSLPIKPSPNLPNDQAINLYPSLCFFEGSNVSVGRGTTKQFQIFGSPYLDKSKYEFSFFPSPKPGASNPKHDGKLCYGRDLSTHERLEQLDLSFLITAYKNSIDKSLFFTDFFTKLAGTKTLEAQIKAGKTEQEIKASWEEGLAAFEKTRETYLIYD
ncbi:DUF1343 domain-containing protein [Subsaximicrobium wynnwilliamsii]|uniref:DUF1343 domain-containing protein n=1 Tax=Subsaximicrobium wynnwilliamsii TaxID=291179 RepID=A0A5C6ZCP8_9FLAO|nr:DUF1343 domain-containing protein [Subsaximicrobium wynnwilliamsii]TXD81745.1 DUF1343 domain-containing protein [Subsaximicrobium wynnwilliamsii]TXD87571.1 DUF1343 domain-containing protein [Subsaximicrobium wynnwilliamsii]TXE01244.1 DUF1343 domain-containing protein [Subsaximicrobium wynnwilliamsii]